MAIPIAVIAVLVVANAAFVVAEFAIVGAPRAAIDTRAAKGDRLALLVQGVLRDPRKQDRYIATAQIGITVASLGLGMYGEHVLAGWVLDIIGRTGWIERTGAHLVASVVAVALLTYFHIVLGEMVPKSLALQSAERMALWITPPMLWLEILLFPFVYALNTTGNAVLEIVGVKRQARNADQYYTSEELQLIVEESEQQGALRAESGQMLQDLFEFGDLTASQVMVPRVRVIGIPVGADSAELRRIIGASPHTRYPIYDGDLDHILGMCHIKDLLRLLMTNRSVAPGAARPAPVVPDTAPLDAVLATMRRERAQLAVVIDEHGGTAGLVTLEDLFEEVVGDIDEGGAGPRGPRRDSSGRCRVPGTMRVDEVGQLFDLDLSHEDVDSVSGLVLTLLGRPPRVGDSVHYERLRLDVTAVKGHGVEEAAVSLLPPRPEQ